MPTIGQSIVFKGELSGDEDLEIDGQIEGSVRFEKSQLTIGPNGHVQAEVHAKSIVVIGRVTEISERRIESKSNRRALSMAISTHRACRFKRARS